MHYPENGIMIGVVVRIVGGRVILQKGLVMQEHKAWGRALTTNITAG